MSAATGGGDSKEYLARLTPAEVTAFERCGRRSQWKRGATLFSEGDPSDWVVALRSGRVKVSSFTDQGTEVVLAIRGPDALVGELSAIDSQPRSATVSALEPVAGIVISVAEFTGFLRSHPRAAVCLMQMVSDRLRDADRKRIEFGSSDALGRVAGRLVELAERFGATTQDGIRIALPLSQQELAGWIGCSRDAVAKALRVLRDRGWIDTQRRQITVRDVAALRDQAR
ncbi:MAG: Crp/Fnr family transcriptional regulator [Pseudonocardiales bacterium]|nr:MAG: Crp/Fnr family transcriptional regulator [Pseudonocardiales bacterium]